MIFKSLKRSAIKKRIEAHLQKRVSNPGAVSKLTDIAVLIDASETIDIISILKLAGELGVNPDRVKVMGFVEEKKELEDKPEASYYNNKSFSLNGSVKRDSLQHFIDKDFDILINFYSENKLELNYVATLSKAKLKVGFAEVDHRINDLIIGGSSEQQGLFISELKKYLKILQII
ncbi:DUF6913 domain-containing protein [Aquimarina brevivitae]|uniref:Uncharacterized protein n=1 Tax=Aquimarina brevivitae TaxID=323412 RepID=A0A4Q7NYR9_9FLAO|nr:hypothetical protein [Aquimarina brevivitae]RZS92611.1 hypothetical protein EV197_2749 [Aquimarina brevivitae]